MRSRPWTRPAGRGSPRSPAAVAGDAQGADQRREGEALHHEGEEDHREGEEDDQVTVGERRPRVDGQRYRQRGGQRNGAPHAAPRHDHPGPDADASLPLAGPAVEGADDVRHGHRPHDAGEDDGAADRQRITGEVADRVAPERVDHCSKLQADEHEQDGVDQEVEDVPDEDSLQPRARAR